MSTFEKNLHMLKANHPHLFQVASQPFSGEGHLRLFQTKQGVPGLIVLTDDGEQLVLHDEQDPLGIAEVTAGRVVEDKEGVFVLMGLELGYLAKAIAQKMSDRSALVIYESDPGIFQMALGQTTLTDVLESSRIKFIVGDPAGLGHWCSLLLPHTGGPVHMVGCEWSDRLIPKPYRTKIDHELARRHSISLATRNALQKRGNQFVANILENVPHILLSSGIQGLKGLSQGMVAALVAAGPSLEKNVRHLQRIKNRGVIIAADTALGYLLACDIIPDFVVSADPQETTYLKFDGVDIPRTICLVFHPAANHQIVKRFPGPKCVMDCSMPVYQWLSRHWATKGSLERETMCQVHIGFNLAEWLGCEKIILVGQDLSYTDQGMHVKGGSYIPDPDIPIVVSRGRPVKDMFGQPVLTDPTFLNYKTILEKKIADFPGWVVNATEGGLRIQGAELCRLIDVIAEWCQGPPVDVLAHIHAALSTQEDVRWQDLLEDVKARIRDCFRVGRTAGHIVRLLQRIEEKRQSSKSVDDELIRLGQRVERLTGLIPRYSQIRKLLHWMDISLEQQLQQHTRAAEQIKDLELRRDKELERGIGYYDGLARVSPLFGEYLRRVNRRLEGLHRAFQSSSHVGKDFSPLGFVERLRDLELYDEAIWCLDILLNESADSREDVQAHRLSVWLALEVNQIGLARERLKAVDSNILKDEEFTVLADRIETRWKAWRSRVETAKQFLVPLSDTAMAAGDFYHRTGNVALAKYFYSRAIEEEVISPDRAWKGFEELRVTQTPPRERCGKETVPHS